MLKNRRKIIRFIFIAWAVSFNVWLWYSMMAKDVPSSTFQSDHRIQVDQTKDLISFTPATNYTKVLLFFPGALVAPEAYAPLCRKIAESGCKCIIIKMPWRLAQFGYTAPKELGLFNDTTKQYILAGHSKGAAMATRFVYENPGLIDYLILMGTTHPKDIDLSSLQIPVMKIYGSKDGVAPVGKINNNKPKLPATTTYVLIEGANHSQFGYYGPQLGDDEASISREKQQEVIRESVIKFIEL